MTNSQEKKTITGINFRHLKMKSRQDSKMVSLVAQLVKNSPAMHVTPVRFPGWEDPLEKG